MPTINDWNDFLYKLGENFYDFVHGQDTSYDDLTPVSYPYFISYKGAGCLPIGFGSSISDNLQPYTCDFIIDSNHQYVFDNVVLCDGITNKSGYYAKQVLDRVIDVDFSVSLANSYFNDGKPFYVNNVNYVGKYNAANSFKTGIFSFDFLYNYYTDNSHSIIRSVSKVGSGKPVILSSFSTHMYSDYTVDGVHYDYYFDGTLPVSLDSSYDSSGFQSPSIITDSPVYVNSSSFNVSSNWNTSVKNIYIDNGDTITTYNYTTNEGDNITINYSVDGDGIPTGYIDFPISNDISFDDLFDMFNTILAPLVGIGLDVPDWNTYLPPVVTGVGGDTYINNGDIVNVDGDYYNVDFPAFTGEYPIETIAPLSTEFFIGTPPALPALTMDNAIANETASAVGAGFTFFDGLGLFTPFIILATVRLLVSKFRGDS